MRQEQFFTQFENEFSQREFNPNDTLQWLSANRIILASWGFEKPLAIKNSGLIFKVNGHHHKGWVLITLAWNDTYTVRFLNIAFEEVKPKLTEVYCDELQARIDEVVERIDAYEQ